MELVKLVILVKLEINYLEMKRTKIVDVLKSTDFGKEVCVKGWVRTHRSSKAVDFIALNDGSTIKNVQVVVDPSKFDEQLLKDITTGACICAVGTLVESQGAGQTSEVQATALEIYGLCDNTYPMQFFYFHTPLITASDCEGAGNMFQVTTKNLYDLKKDEQGKIIYDDDFFGEQTSLTVSGQLEGELGATALGAIYTFGPTFRAENSNTPRHLAEFWMVEPEVAFLEQEELMDLEEDFIKYCVRWALDNCQDDLQFLNQMIDKTLIERLEGVLKETFVRLPYTEGINILQDAIKKGKKFEFPCNWGDDLASEHERYLVEEHFKKPVIMTDYPREFKSFYMKQNQDMPDGTSVGYKGAVAPGPTMQGTDVLFPQIGEIIGGSVREESYDKLMGEINRRQMDMTHLWWYIDTRKWGSCPHAGFGLGFERLILFVTGMQNIRDVIPFPRTPKSAEF